MSENEKSMSLINFDGLSQVACSLIDKISSAVGWIATHDTPNRIAVKQYIESIQNSDLDPLIKAAKISRAKRDIKEYCNQAKIISDAIPQLDATADPNKIDEDWLASFMDKARLVNSESLQAIWSRILAQECNESQSIPKHLLDILSYISPIHAHKFNLLCQFGVQFFSGNEKAPLTPIVFSFDPSGDDIYSRSGLFYYDLQNLDSLGLLKYSSTSHVMEFSKKPEQPYVIIGNHRYSIHRGDTGKSLNIGCVILTTDGSALSTIIERELSEEFCQTCIQHWKAQGFELIEVCEDQAKSTAADTANQN